VALARFVQSPAAEIGGDPMIYIPVGLILLIILLMILF
jgi:hypothetical protein